MPGEYRSGGSRVWLSKNVSVMPGENIGEKSVIGANAVVTHDINSVFFCCGISGTGSKVMEFCETLLGEND